MFRLLYFMFFINGILSYSFNEKYQSEKELVEIKSYYESFSKFLSKIQTGGAGLSEVLENFQKVFEELKNENNNITDDAINLELCIKEFEIIINDTVDLKFYALRFWDSWAVPESGILEGNVRWPGHYYECLEAKNNEETDLQEVKGRWCNSYLGQRLVSPSFGTPIDITWGSCFPSVCSQTSVKTILSLVLSEVNFLPPLLDVYCPVPFTSFTTPDIIGLVIIILLLCLVVVGTFRGIYVNSNPKTSSFESTVWWGKILDCFSIISNGRKILSIERRPGILPILDGVRFLSTTWVILGHSMMLPLYGVDNGVFASRTIREHLTLLMPVENGTFSVDSFFFLSGLLVVYLTLKHLNKTRGKINILLMYLQRFLRLTPVYAFLILLSTGLIKYFGFGPFWNKFANTSCNVCKKYWFSNLLYINNFYPISSECFSWGWYLANDMQFYLISPFFVILIYKWPKVGLVTLGTAIVGSIVLTGIFADGLPPPPILQSLQITVLSRFVINTTADDPSYKDEYRANIYHMPWYRFGAYGVGMVTGYILYTTKRKIKLHKGFVVYCWCSAIAISMAIIYGPYKHVKNKTVIENDKISDFYNAITRPLWASCLAWVTVACSVGYGGPIKTFLNWKIFTPLSNLTYGAYLVHVYVIFWFMAIKDIPFHFTVMNIIYLYLGTLVFSFAVAFIVALLVEWPFIGLLKILFSGVNRKNECKKNELSDNITQEPKVSFSLGEVNLDFKPEGTAF